MTLIFNLVMFAVDAIAIAFIIRRRGFWPWFAAMSFAATIAAVLGVLLGGKFENHFGVIRLWSHGLFLHVAGLLFASAFIHFKSRPLPSAALGIAAVAMASVAVDSFFVEPTWLEVSYVKIESPKISRPLRIVVVADLQTDNIGQYERDVLRRTMDENPDLILLAGDYIQAPWRQHERLQRELREYLMEIDFGAPLGALAVRGNVDPDHWTEIFNGTTVAAVDARKSFDLGELQLTCLSLSDSHRLDTEVVNSNPKKFHLVLGHIPNFALAKVDADLLLAGHTHGGQVVIPFLGPITTHSLIPNAWASGLTDLPGGRKLLVSRGIGMERHYAPPMRFLCRPELVVIELTPQKVGDGEARSQKK